MYIGHLSEEACMIHKPRLAACSSFGDHNALVRAKAHPLIDLHSFLRPEGLLGRSWRGNFRKQITPCVVPQDRA